MSYCLISAPSLHEPLLGFQISLLYLVNIWFYFSYFPDSLHYLIVGTSSAQGLEATAILTRADDCPPPPFQLYLQLRGSACNAPSSCDLVCSWDR